MRCPSCSKRLWFFQTNLEGKHGKCWIRDKNIKSYEEAMERYRDMSESGFFEYYKQQRLRKRREEDET